LAKNNFVCFKKNKEINMKKKFKLFSTIASLCLAVCLMAFGVYAATQATYGIKGKVSFSAVGEVHVRLDSVKVYKSSTLKLDAAPEDMKSAAYTWGEATSLYKFVAETPNAEYDYRTDTEAGAPKADADGAFKDEIAFAFSNEDPLAPAKVLCKFAEENETFKVKVGMMDGAVMSAEEVTELSKIPSKEILIGKILGSIQSSLYGLAYVLQAKIDKEGGAPEAAAE
jgi:hypothetical protein